MQRTIVRTQSAPAAIGPYSQAVSVPFGDKKMVFCSGMVALDPVTGELATGGVEEETRIALNNLGAVLVAAGASFANVVKTTVYLTTMDNFAKINPIYGERFTSDPPARATIAVAGLPRGALIEIDAIAIV